MARNIRISENGKYIITTNYGGLKEGTVLNVTGSTPDSYIITWRGKTVYIPESLVKLDIPRQFKPKKRQNEFTRN